MTFSIEVKERAEEKTEGGFFGLKRSAALNPLVGTIPEGSEQCSERLASSTIS